MHTAQSLLPAITQLAQPGSRKQYLPWHTAENARIDLSSPAWSGSCGYALDHDRRSQRARQLHVGWPSPAAAPGHITHLADDRNFDMTMRTCYTWLHNYYVTRAAARTGSPAQVRKHSGLQMLQAKCGGRHALTSATRRPLHSGLTLSAVCINSHAGTPQLSKGASCRLTTQRLPTQPCVMHTHALDDCWPHAAPAVPEPMQTPYADTQYPLLPNQTRLSGGNGAMPPPEHRARIPAYTRTPQQHRCPKEPAATAPLLLDLTLDASGWLANEAGPAAAAAPRTTNHQNSPVSKNEKKEKER